MKDYFKTKWQAITLFFMDLFKMPAKDGTRRLYKNVFTKKWSWTEGLEPVFKNTKEQEAYNAMVMSGSTSIVEVFNPTKDDNNPVNKRVNYEPIMNARFIFEFPGVEPYLIRGYIYNGKLSAKKASNGKIKVREQSSFEMYSPIGYNNDLDIAKMSKKKTSLGTATIQLLDPTGVSVRDIIMKNVKIENVNMYSYLDYVLVEPLAIGVTFSHDEREFK